MGGRDHSCEGCGRGGLNDPDGRCVCGESEHDQPYEWRAVARDFCSEDYAGPYATRDEAEAYQRRVFDIARPPYDKTWVERRPVTEWERAA